MQNSHQLTMTVLMTPDMANFAGYVHGGTILKLLDQVAYACASRYASRYVVTISVDQVIFRERIHVGELVTFLAAVNHTGRSSMEIRYQGGRRRHPSQAQRHVNSCCYDGGGGHDGRPIVVPMLEPRPKERERFDEAVLRKSCD
jgi:acyl-CoA hydrolase